jgi:hypothetical protein
MTRIFIAFLIVSAVEIWSRNSTAAGADPVPITLDIAIPQGFCGQWALQPQTHVTYSSMCTPRA